MSQGLIGSVTAFYDIQVSKQYRYKYLKSTLTFEKRKYDKLPKWQLMFFQDGADRFLTLVNEHLCTKFSSSDGKTNYIPEISKEQRALMVFARVMLASQEIIDKLKENATSQHVFVTASYPQPKYAIDYPLLLKTLVIPAVVETFPESCIEYQFEPKLLPQKSRRERGD
ncbi:MAG: hypothetical protein H7A42_06315 [Chlamydiales bacterium]|nr:hypothetical protein [Chlamydiales bacterium]